MIKNIIIAFGLFVSITLCSSAWATEYTTGNLTFKSSPSTVMDFNVTNTHFALVSASSKTTTDNGIEYLLISSDGYIRQKTQATDGEASTAPAADIDPDTLTGWTTKGGS